MTILLIVLGIFWYVSGVVGIAYWWTTSYDLEKRDSLPLLFVGLGGPFCWLFGSPTGNSKVLIRRRVNK